MLSLAQPAKSSSGTQNMRANCAQRGTPMTTDPSRDAFEDFLRDKWHPSAHAQLLARTGSEYSNHIIQERWVGWQAAMAHKDESSAPAKPLGDELPQGFISDVLTAAGLVRHGRQCKALADRLGDAVEQIWTISIAQREALPAAPLPQGE